MYKIFSNDRVRNITINGFLRFLFSALLASSLTAGIITNVSVSCAGNVSTNPVSASCQAPGLPPYFSGARATASLNSLFVDANWNGPFVLTNTASASVMATFLLTFQSSAPGAVGGLYTPCFELSMDARGAGGRSTAFFSSLTGSLFVGLAGPPAIQQSQTCSGGSANQTYIPFEYGVPQWGTMSMSAFAAGSGSESTLWVRFTGFQFFDSPGRPAQGATAVIDVAAVPEPATAILVLIAPVLLLLHRAHSQRRVC